MKAPDGLGAKAQAPSPAPDRFAAARTVADAVLYEGYVLYPYRASSTKNQVRWQFGVLVPPAYQAVEPSERSASRTECLLDPSGPSRLFARLRCLQLQRRTVERLASDGSFVPVGSLDSTNARFLPFDEAVEQVVDLGPIDLDALQAFDKPPTPAVGDADGSGQVTVEVRAERLFAFESGEGSEAICAEDGEALGRLLRLRGGVQGRLRACVLKAAETSQYLKVVVTVENLTSLDEAPKRRDEALAGSLIATHVMLSVEGGHFVSLLDPPPDATQVAGGCHSEGSYPVLIDDTVVLSSPIILYDRPEIAPESPGDLYDSTEIDEILALRVLTLSEDEKREARGTDWRAARVVERCESMAPESWARLHGAVRSFGPPDPAGAGAVEAAPVEAAPVEAAPVEAARAGAGAVEAAPAEAAPAEVPWWDPEADAQVDPWNDSIVVGGIEIRKGVSVRLRPSRRSDAQDLFLDGLRATVAGVFHDVDGAPHVAVALDDDPAAPELSWQGRYLFFHPEEVVPVADPPARVSPRVLVAGIGNIFLGDDGFGPAVVRRLGTGNLGSAVRVADFGIRGIHLAYELLDGYEAAVLVDSVDIGAAPGTLAVIEPLRGGGGAAGGGAAGAGAAGGSAHAAAAGDAASHDDAGDVAALDAHSMSPEVVLATLDRLGGRLDKVVIVGCQPAALDESMELSLPVASVLDEAVRLCESVLTELLQPAGKG